MKMRELERLRERVSAPGEGPWRRCAPLLTALTLVALTASTLGGCETTEEEPGASSLSEQPAARADMELSRPSDLAAPLPAPDRAPAGPQTPPAPAAPVESCEAAELQACFGSPDCPEDARCENVGSEALPTPCCVAGARGPRLAGEACDPDEGQLQCASGLCIVGEEREEQARCSGPCLEDSECPPEVPRCVLLPFDETSSGWCFPE